MSTLLLGKKLNAFVPVPLKETRRAARFSVNLTGFCYMSAELVGDGNKFDGCEVAVKDISSRGTCIITTFPLDLFKVIKIAFPIQTPISNYIYTPPTLAEVRWTHIHSNSKYISGLRFLI